MVNKKVSTPSRPASLPQSKEEKAPRRATPTAPTAAAKPAPRPATPRAVTEQPSRWGNIQRIFRETVAELRKVQWPDRITTRNLTLVVIGMSTVLAAVLGLLDAILTRLIQWLVGL